MRELRDGPPMDALRHSHHGTGSSSSSGGGTASSYSTSTLLKEISSLRSRLKDLEDDTRSSVISEENRIEMEEKEKAVVIMLRKELAKVEQQKANLEKEFMNQLSNMACDNRTVVSDLQDKLVRSQALNEELKDQLKNGPFIKKGKGGGGGDNAEAAERMMDLVETERENHNNEIEQMKKTLESSDMEIADNRREMDHLHGQLDEMVVEKEELLREVTELRLAYSEEQRRAESLRVELKQSNATVSELRKEVSDKDTELQQRREEVGGMNDNIIELESHKEMLVSEITDLRMQLSRKENLRRSPPDGFNAAATDHSKCVPIAEREALEDDIRLMEGRLQRAQAKITEKDATIHSLATSLSEEQKQIITLKGELKSLQNEQQQQQQRCVSSNSNSRTRSRSSSRSPTNNSTSSNTTATTATSNSTDNNTNEKKPSSSSFRRPMAVNTTTTTSTPSRNNTNKISPRTPVSGIVASFEARISGKPITNNSTATAETGSTTTTTSSSSTGAVVTGGSHHHRRNHSADVQSLSVPPLINNISRETVSDLRGTIHDLQGKLEHEKNVVRDLRLDLEAAQQEIDSSRGNNNLQSQIDDKVEEINRLRAKSEVDAGTLMDLQDKLRHEQALVKELRSQLSDAHAVSDKTAELEEQLASSRREVDVLAAQIEGYESARVNVQEKTRKEQSELARLRMKAHQAQTEKRDLETKVNTSQREVERLKTELSYTLDIYTVQDEKKDDGEDEEEVERLQSQVTALQSELTAAMTEIDNLLSEMEGLKNALRTEQLTVQEMRKKAEDDTQVRKTSKVLDGEMNHIKVELTKTQLAKKDLESEYERRVRELEEEMDALETEAEAEISERDHRLEAMKETLAEKEARISRLEVEQTQISNTMNNKSASVQDEMEDLQAELIAMNSKTSVQAREIQSLKMKIVELEEVRDEVEERYKLQIRDMEDTITKLRTGCSDDMELQDLEQLKNENAKLREAIRDVKLERRVLKERLDSLTTTNTQSRTTQVLRDRNAALKEEVEKLSKRLKKMEGSITRFAI